MQVQLVQNTPETWEMSLRIGGFQQGVLLLDFSQVPSPLRASRAQYSSSYYCVVGVIFGRQRIDKI